jgi:hypothetical protein
MVITGQQTGRGAFASSVASQVVSSLGNFLLMVVAAAALDAGALGVFSLQYGVIAFAGLLLRAAVGETVLIRGDIDGGDRATAGRLALSCTFAGCGLALGLVALYGLLTGGGAVATLSLALAALSVPLAESLRSILVFGRRAAVAVRMDVAWFALQSIILVLLGSTGRMTTPGLLLAWGTGAAVGAIIALAVLRWNAATLLADLRAFHRTFGVTFRRLAAETVLSTGVPLGVLLVLGGLGATAEVGRYRLAVLPFYPILPIIAALSLGALGNPRFQERRMIGAISVVGVALLSAAFAVTVAVPVPVGLSLFGDNWTSLRQHAPLGFAVTAAWLVAQVLSLQRKRAGDAATVVRARVVGSVVCLVATPLLLGSPTAGTAVLVITLGHGANAAHLVRHHQRSRAPVTVGDSPGINPTAGR